MERVESHVTVPPSEITIESDGEERSGALTVTEDVRSQVRCVTRLSNPAPRLSCSQRKILLAATLCNERSMMQKIGL